MLFYLYRLRLGRGTSSCGGIIFRRTSNWGHYSRPWLLPMTHWRRKNRASLVSVSVRQMGRPWGQVRGWRVRCQSLANRCISGRDRGVPLRMAVRQAVATKAVSRSLPRLSSSRASPRSARSHRGPGHCARPSAGGQIPRCLSQSVAVALPETGQDDPTPTAYPIA